MFCPECGSEYREGYTRCYECQVDLVDELPEEAGGPDEAEDFEMATVLETGNPVLLTVVKSALDEADIEHFATGEEVQYLLGAGGLGIGFNPTSGPVKIKVRPEDEARARALIEDIDESKLEESPEEESPE